MSAQPREIPMPGVDEGSGEFTMTAWHKHVGAEVAADEVIAEAMTDKVNIEIRSPMAGTLTEILAAEDTTVVAGQGIALLAPSAPETVDPGADQE